MKTTTKTRVRKIFVDILMANRRMTAFMQAADVFERFKVVIDTTRSMMLTVKEDIEFNEEYFKKLVDALSTKTGTPDSPSPYGNTYPIFIGVKGYTIEEEGKETGVAFPSSYLYVDKSIIMISTGHKFGMFKDFLEASGYVVETVKTEGLPYIESVKYPN